MTTSDERVRALQRLLMRDLPSEGVVDVLDSARAVSDRLIRHLTPLLGQAGVRALHERSLVLTSRQHPWFDATLWQQDRSPGPAPADPERMLQASVAWLGQYIGLLETFIGERLTLRILHGIWPDVFLLGSKKESP